MMKKFISLTCTLLFILKVQADPCEAYFTYDVNSYTIFLNGSGSAGDVLSWHWYINGDLFSDAGPETQITPGEWGEHEICLVIETGAGCVDTFCHGVLVEEPSGDCEAHFTWSVEGFTILLNGSTSTGDVVSWHWYVNGDLFSDAGPETQITVGETGEYQICLVIETAAGCVDEYCHGVLVEEPSGDCEAHFTWSVEGFTILLNGSTSTGDVVSWHWNVNGDLFSDAGPETQITVGETGEYQICLVIETAAGCVDEYCHGVLVEEPSGDCEAHFTSSVDGFTILLNGSTSADEVVSWHWLINGDLFSDDGPETHITVGESGEYQICLVIETATGCIDTFCHGVLVEEPSGDCEAHFTWNVEGFFIFLDGSASAGDVASWHWFINGDLFSDDGPETHFTVGESGEYQICLVIETATGCVDTFCHGVLVEEPSGNCEAHFTWDVEGFTIFLDGSTSVGDVVSWHWYINNEIFSDDGPQTQITIDEWGEYQICLVIETAAGCIDEFCHSVLVEEPSGDCEAHFTWNVEGFIIFLDGSASAGDVASWHWFINGDLFSDDGPETHFTVGESGEYQICLVIETAGGCIDTFCHGVLVEEPSADCEAGFTWNAEGFTIFLNGSTSTGDVASWHWFINGDLFSDDGPEIQITVSESGEYQICLVIETAAGCADTFCDQIIIEGIQGGEYDFKMLPPNADGSLNIVLSSPNGGSFEVYITEMTGKKVFEQSVSLLAGTQQYVIPVKRLATGICLISILFNGETMKTLKTAVMK